MQTARPDSDAAGPFLHNGGGEERRAKTSKQQGALMQRGTELASFWRRTRGRRVVRAALILLLLAASLAQLFRSSIHPLAARLSSQTTSLTPEAAILAQALQTRLSSPVPSPPYRFVLATLEHNAAESIYEWLLYHISLGIEHFVVYDLRSTDTTLSLLQPFIDLGWVTLLASTSPSPSFVSADFIETWSSLSSRMLFLSTEQFLTRDRGGAGAEDGGDLVEWYERRYGREDRVELVERAFLRRGQEAAGGVLGSCTEAARDFIEGEEEMVILRGSGRHSEEPKEVERMRRTREGEEVKEEGELLYVSSYRSSRQECLSKSGVIYWPDFALESYCTWTSGVEDQQEDGALDEQVDTVQGMTLAPYGLPLRSVAEWSQQRFPPFSPQDYSLSTSLSTSTFASNASSAPAAVLAGTTITLSHLHGGVGFLDVVLSTADSRRFLPLSHHPDGSATFTIPTTPLFSIADNTTVYELVVTFQHPSSPDPTIDPVSPCTVMRHLSSKPDVVQLKQLREGVCRDTDVERIWALAQWTWPHSHYQGVVLFRRLFTISPSSSSAAVPSLDTSSSSLHRLAPGTWRRFPLFTFPSPSSSSASTPPSPANSDVLPRLYTPTRCPSHFSTAYWNTHCADEASLVSQGGALRWVPEGATSYADYSLPSDELEQCLQIDDGSDGAAPRPTRILIVGDSVSSHHSAALYCLVEQAKLSPYPSDFIRYTSLQYETFNIVGAGGLAPLSEADWIKLLAWDASAEGRRLQLPDLVVLNIGLWALSWGSAAGFSTGLRSTLTLLLDLFDSHPPSPSSSISRKPRLLWRETTAVTPSLTGDPHFQTNPRVELFNRLAREVTEELGIATLEAYEMTAARGKDGALDNAHWCPMVQGELAEMLMWKICRGGLLE